MPQAPEHPLDPLLAPSSIALVGASAKPDSAGRAMVEMARIDGYAGRVYPVNPGYPEIAGLPCYPNLETLPTPAEHVVLGLANAKLEAALEAAIAHGAKAATIFASCRLEWDHSPGLAERLRAKADAAGMHLCGGSSMGFYNRAIGLRVAGFPSPAGLTEGAIAWIAQSGSAFSALAHNDRRLGFALCVSSGMELTTTVGDYIDWALNQAQTRVVGLFLEGAHAPDRLRAALERAAERAVPVVALKVGRSARGAEMAATHTGALAGSDAAWRALFRRCGVIEVEDLDELAAALQLFEQPRRIGPGALAAIHDSGGERELIVDMAEGLGLPFAEINEATRRRLAPDLEAGLTAENPLDAWGTAENYERRFCACLTALLEDEATALGIFFSDPRDDYWYSAGVAEAVRKASLGTTKPVALACNTALAGNSKLALSLRRDGVPLLIGARPALLAARHALNWRDAQARRRRSDPVPAGPGERATRQWRERLADGTLFEAEALDLLADWGIATPSRHRAADAQAAVAAARTIGFPVVLKTAEAHAHKTELGGVVLGIESEKELLMAYRDLSDRLGPRVLVQAMAPKGVEIALGALEDREFGPVVMVAAGGVLVELLDDAAFALPPFGEEEAGELIAGLKVARLLEGWRGGAAADRAALARSLAAFSRLAADLAGSYRQIDINPVIAGAEGTIAVDAVIL